MMCAQPTFDLADKRIWVAGHRGMVGRAMVRRLAREDCKTIITADRNAVDLTRQSDVENWFGIQKPQIVVIAAAKVGGILANNTYPADFLYENLMIETNIIHAAYQMGVEKLVFLGSSCIYPKYAAQPIEEESLLTGPLEPTNEWYAIAKIAGIKLCQAYRRQYGVDFISAMPTNLYGPHDNFDLETSHVIPALIRKVVEAKESGAKNVEIWGTGKPRREFMHVDDCADALVHLLKNYSGEEHLNIGAGTDISIKELVELIAELVGFAGEITSDVSKPDGVPRKLMSNSKLIKMGWMPKISLESGLRSVIEWRHANHT